MMEYLLTITNQSLIVILGATNTYCRVVMHLRAEALFQFLSLPTMHDTADQVIPLK